MTLPSSSRSAPADSSTSPTAARPPASDVIDDETALHHGFRRAEPYPSRVGARTAEQVQAGDHHRLARTGLAGEHGQTVVELRAAPSR